MEVENIKDAQKFTVKAFVFDSSDAREGLIRRDGFDSM